MAAGTRLPSSRRLASELDVSRGVVADTYDQLAAEGYLDVTPRQAPIVAPVAATRTSTTESAALPWRVDFAATAPDVDLFPRRAWLRATDRALRDAPGSALDYGDHRGRVELRKALSDYLARVRAVRVEPERIVITQGYTQALGLLCRVRADRGATSVSFETPAPPEQWAPIRASGMTIEPIPVDVDGLLTDDLDRLTAAAIVVTPAHQFPTGAVMAPARRHSLVDWAARTGRLIVEDDYDAEFRYDREAVGALQGLDPDRVVHVGTASKTPRTGRQARLDESAGRPHRGGLRGEVGGRRWVAHRGPARAREPPGFGRVRPPCRTDPARLPTPARPTHRVTLGAASPPHGPRAAAGLHVLLRLPAQTDDRAVSAAAASHGIRVSALSPMSLVEVADRGLVLGYGRLPVERIDGAVAALAAVLHDGGVDEAGQASSA